MLLLILLLVPAAELEVIGFSEELSIKTLLA